jgi:hypothetical protein
MSKPALRVVFDTNVFSAAHFEVLEKSPMKALCSAGRIQPVYGHVFVEETLRAYGVATARKALLEKWLPFVAETVNRFCEDFVTIWHRELVQGRGRRTNIFMSTSKQRRLLNGLRAIPSDGTWRGLVGTQLERREEDQKRAEQRKISIEMRNEVVALRKTKQRGVRRRDNVPGLSNRAAEQYIDEEGRACIEANVPCFNPREVWARWARAKMDYPYFTTFVINMICMMDHAVNRTNEKIDLNAQADLDLMTHLLHADVLVSNETGFLKHAFGQIWLPQGKVLFASEQFAAHISKMV